jgi:negative regulator of sigma E activity
MHACDEYQMKVSAMMDGELPAEEIEGTVRHLAACEECMQEFKVFQKLQHRVNRELAQPSVSPQAWEAIRRRATEAPKTIFIPFKSPAVRIAAMAAAVILCFGLGYLMNQPSTILQDPNAPIVLASQPGQMTDDKFLALTRELLTADPEYHQKMYMILSTLNREDRRWPQETLPTDEAASSARMSTADGGESRQTFKF